ncbi:hypothetical protein SDC9_196208 [bioreactor metagenome]|uniref:Uncharacterized protein n=1 Tax=bioreactor metagenome TaxID=1076179 RepID=A0A645IBE0_9ZZZZ
MHRFLGIADVEHLNPVVAQRDEERVAGNVDPRGQFQGVEVAADAGIRGVCDVDDPQSAGTGRQIDVMTVKCHLADFPHGETRRLAGQLRIFGIGGGVVKLEEAPPGKSEPSTVKPQRAGGFGIFHHGMFRKRGPGGQPADGQDDCQ